MKVLFIEDDRALHKLAERQLQRQGFSVVCVDSGEDGLKAAHTGVDAVIVDLGLPGIGGLHVIEVLRAQEHTAQLPVIVVTARCGLQDHALALECGADAFFEKPASWEALGDELRRLASERKVP